MDPSRRPLFTFGNIISRDRIYCDEYKNLIVVGKYITPPTYALIEAFLLPPRPFTPNQKAQTRRHKTTQASTQVRIKTLTKSTYTESVQISNNPRKQEKPRCVKSGTNSTSAPKEQAASPITAGSTVLERHT
jgi:hypothetical protein